MAGFTSDDFSGGLLNPFWLFFGPAGGNSLLSDGTDGYLQLTANGGGTTAGVMQATTNTDFGIETRFLSSPTQQFQQQGLLVEQDANNSIRFEINSDGTQQHVVATVTLNGVSTVMFDLTVAAGAASHLRIDRAGDAWSFQYSADGLAWTAAGNFVQVLTAASVGVFSGTTGGIATYTAQVDYFFDSAAPILNEDATIPHPPVAQDDAIAGAEDTPVNGNVLLDNGSGPDSDIDGDPLSVSAVNGVAANVGAQVTLASGALLTLNADGTFSYDPNGQFESLLAGQSALDSFAYTISDGVGGTDTATVTVTIAGANEAPVAQDDTAVTVLNTPLILNVASDLLANDSDAEGDPLIFTGFGQPLNGVLTDNGDGTLTYTPNAGFAGADSFTYTIADGNGGTDSASVALLVRDPASLPLPPTVLILPGVNNFSGATGDVINLPHDAVYAIAQGTVAFSFTANNVNARQGLITKDAANFDGGGNHLAIYIENGVLKARFQDGTASITLSQGGLAAGQEYEVAAAFGANGAALYLDGVLVGSDPSLIMSWTTNQEFLQIGGLGWGSATGDGSFTNPFAGQIADVQIFSEVLSDAQVIELIIDNTPPVAVNDTIVLNEDTSITFQPGVNDTDADGDPVTAGTIATAPSNGTAVVNADRTVTYTPNANFNGVDSFDVAVTDGRGGADTATVSVTVNPTADNPVAVNDAAQTPVDTPLIIDVLANDADPDGDPISVFSFTQGTNGGVVLNPDGTLTYTPIAGFSGIDSFTYTAEALGGLSNAATATVLVGPQAGIFSDDFSADTLGLDWSFQGPAGTAGVATIGTDAFLEIAVPQGNFQPFGTNTSARVMQAARNEDFGIEAKFLSVPTQNFQMQGLLIEQDTGNWIRFDNYSDGIQQNVFAAVTLNGVTSAKIDLAVANGAASYLRIERTGDDWSFQYSADGQIWTTAGSFTQVLNVTQTGIFAGNTGGAPGHTAQADYFFNTAEPIANEDATIPHPPVAQDDTVTAVLDTPLVLNIATDLLANDSDTDGDPLTFTGFGQPANGTLTDNSDGTLTYSPNLSFFGSDSFTYTISDGTGRSDSASVTINVGLSSTLPPTVLNLPGVNNFSGATGDVINLPHDAAYAIAQGTVAFSFTANNVTNTQGLVSKDASGFTGGGNHLAVYIENGVLKARFQDGTASITLSQGGLAAGQEYEVAAAFGANGAALYLDGVLVGSDPSLIMSWTTNQEFLQIGGLGWGSATGDGSFTNPFAGQIADVQIFSEVLSDAQIVDLGNKAPVAVNDTIVLDEDTSITFQPGANDTDADGDPVTAGAVALAPSNGTAIINADGTVTYTPNADFNGVDNFDVAVTDGRGGVDTATVTVTVNPVADNPVAVDDAAQTPEDTPLVIDVLANDTDADGELLSVIALTQGVNGGVVLNPDGTLTYTPNAGFGGIDSFTYTAGDGLLGSLPSTATVTIVVGPPAGITSDDFSSDTLGSEWSQQGPAGTIDFILNGAEAFLEIAVPQGTFQPWNNNTSTRIMQAARNEDFGIEAKFLSVPAQKFQMQGLLIEQDAGNWIRFDNYSDGSKQHIFAAVTLNGASSAKFDLFIPSGAAAFLRIERAGDDWSFQYSADGQIWTTAGSFTQALNVTQTGIFAGNSGGALGFTAQADYFFNTAFPIAPEDPPNTPPVALDDTASTDMNAPLVLSVADLLANDSDADGHPLTFTSFAQPANGALTDNGDGTLTYTPNTGFASTDSFTYTISDGKGGTDSASATVFVRDPASAPPVAFGDTAATGEDTAAVIDILANDSDPDGDPLTLISVGAAANGTVTIDDGGTPGIPGDDTVIYTPDADFNGADSFTYTITDGRGHTATATATVTVNPVNDAPVAAGDIYSIANGTTLNIAGPGVLANDTDVEGDALSAAIATGVSNGALVLNLDGSFTYTPNAGFIGIDSFTYRAGDGTAQSNVATVKIEVGLPAGIDSDDFSGNSLGTNWSLVGPAGTATLASAGAEAYLEIAVPQGDFQPWNNNTAARVMQAAANENFGIEAKFLSVPTQKYQLQGLLVEQDASNWIRFDNYSNGTQQHVFAAVTVNGASSAKFDLTVSTGAAAYLRIERAGNDWSFQYSADGQTWTTAGSFTQILNVTQTGIFAGNTGGALGFTAQADYFFNTAAPILNEDPPNTPPAAADDIASADLNTPLTLNIATDILANDSDADGDPLSFAGFAQPLNGILADNGDGTLTYTPNTGFTGADSFTYTLSDGEDTSTASVSLFVRDPASTPPVAIGDAAAVDEDTAAVISVLANDSDPDGDPLTLISVGAAANGTVTIDDGGTPGIPGDDTVIYTPDADFNGADSFTYTVSDGRGHTATATATVTVNPVNDAPAAAGDVFTVPKDGSLNIAGPGVLANDTDVDGDALSAALLTGVSNGALVLNLDGSFTYTPNAGFIGIDSFTYKAGDGTDQSIAATVRIEVGLPANIISDDFSGGTLGEDWSLVGPAGTATLTNAGAEAFLEIAVPAGGDYDAWQTNNSSRVMQAATDENFGIEARFLSTPALAFQMQGLLVEQDANNWIRFDTVFKGGNLHIFAGLTQNGTSSPQIDFTIAAGDASYLRIDRSGDNWTFLYSADGQNWATAGSFIQALTVTQTGIFAGSTGDPAPGHTAQVDYFFNTAAPIVPEDNTPVPPVARDDTATTALDTPVVLSVADDILANDFDPNGDPLTLAGFGQPANGTLADNGDGTLTYTPNIGFAGVDSFTYTLSDGTGTATDTASVFVGVANSSPVALNDAATTNEDTAAIIAVLANDSDANGDTLIVSAVGNPANGTVTISASGSLIYVPDANFSGIDIFTYTVSDNIGTTDATVTVTVAPVNDAPHMVTGTSFFTKQIIDTTMLASHAVVAADFDGDGDIDVAATDFVNGTVAWYENDGNAGFTKQFIDTNLGGAYPAAIADVDGDGDIDVLAAGYSSDTIVWYENNGIGVFTRRDVDIAANGAHSAVAGDMDGDGDMDLLATNQDAGTVTWYENDGFNAFTKHTIDGAAFMAKRAEFADIDADGDMDVVGASFGDDTIAWYENDGNENFTKRIIDTNANGAYYVFPVDMDGDGDIDILTASRLDDTIAWYRNDGAVGFTKQVIDTNADGARSVIAADVNGDGLMDVLATSVNDNTVAWYLNDGNANFSKQAIDSTSLAPYGVFAVDVDGDGNVDVLTASRDDNTIALNLQSKLHPIFVSDGGTRIIGTSLLQATDADHTPAQLIYTLADIPNLGTLLLNNIALTLGGTFTQADIDNGLLSYARSGAGISPDSFAFTISDGTASTSADVQILIGDPIDVWYGDVQSFSNPGVTQEWINILGNVDTSLVASLTYSLNGGADRALSIGTDTRRLNDPGDFNADINISELDGSATNDIVTIKATLADGLVVTKDITIDYLSGNQWASDYSIDWAAVTDIQDAVQVVDGLWSYDAAGIRPVIQGYDRLLTIGDQSWDNYEVNLSVTMHDLTTVDPRGRDGGGLAFGMLWNGHTDDPITGFQPKAGWEPGAAFFFDDDGVLDLHSYNNWNTLLGSQNFFLAEGSTYNFTIRVEQTNIFDRTYSLKFWELGQAEPGFWQVQGTEQFAAPTTGSFYLDAHYYDVTFGDITVTEIQGSDILIGEAGNDVLVGADTAQANPGLGEIDVFTGNAGADTFVFGDSGGVFYDDGNAATDGSGDYGFIWDFQTGVDRIELAGAIDDYVLSNTAAGLPSGTAISLVNAGGPDELIGVINGVTGLSLASADFTLIGIVPDPPIV